MEELGLTSETLENETNSKLEVSPEGEEEEEEEYFIREGVEQEEYEDRDIPAFRERREKKQRIGDNTSLHYHLLDELYEEQSTPLREQLSEFEMLAKAGL